MFPVLIYLLSDLLNCLSFFAYFCLYHFIPSISMSSRTHHCTAKIIDSLLCRLMYFVPASLLHPVSRCWAVLLWVPHNLHLSWSSIAHSFFKAFVSTIYSSRLNNAAVFLGFVFLFSHLWSSVSYIFDRSLCWVFFSVSFSFCSFACLLQKCSTILSMLASNCHIFHH